MRHDAEMAHMGHDKQAVAKLLHELSRTASAADNYQLRIGELESQVSRLLAQNESAQDTHNRVLEGHREALHLASLQVEAVEQRDASVAYRATGMSVEELIDAWKALVAAEANLNAQMATLAAEKEAGQRSISELTKSRGLFARELRVANRKIAERNRKLELLGQQLEGNKRELEANRKKLDSVQQNLITLRGSAIFKTSAKLVRWSRTPRRMLARFQGTLKPAVREKDVERGCR